MSKYKVGDKVKIKTWEQMEQEFGNKNGISDEKWKNILEHIVNDRQEQE